MTDRWESNPIICKGGIHLELDTLTLGTTQPGAAAILQNYEPSIAGGYSRIAGYTKWDTNTVPGDSNTPVLGVCAWLGGVFAARYNTATSSNDISFSTGSGWTKINTSPRGGSVSKVRMLNYSYSAPAIYITDGVNPAAKWDGTTYTLVNGTGAPTNPKYAEYFNGSIVLAGYGSGNSANCQISISAATSDTDFNGADGAVAINVGDVVVGLKRFRDTLYIFCQNSIWELTGTGTSTYALDAVTRQLGCLGQDTILEVGGDLIYLAPDGFRSLAATYRIADLQLGLLSKPITPLILANSFTSNNAPDSFSAVHIASKNQYRAWLYTTGQTKVNAFGVIGKRLDDPVNVQYEWSTSLGIQPYSAHSAYIRNQEVIVIGDPSNGYVYRLESGNDFDGTPISYIYQTPPMTFKDAGLRKVMQKISLYTQASGVINISLNVLVDPQIQNGFQPASIPIVLTSSSATYGTGVYGTSSYAAIQYPVFKLPIVGAGFLVAFQFSGTDSNPVHRIDSFNIEFAPKGRR